MPGTATPKCLAGADQSTGSGQAIGTRPRLPAPAPVGISTRVGAGENAREGALPLMSPDILCRRLGSASFVPFPGAHTNPGFEGAGAGHRGRARTTKRPRPDK